MTELEDSDEARLFLPDVSLRWGAVAVTVNSTEPVGTVVYVDDGKLDAIEGFTFDGADWPDEIREVEVRRIETARPPGT